MKGIVKNSLLILCYYWLVYFVFYFLDVNFHTIFIMPIVLIIFILSLIYLSNIIVIGEHNFKKKYKLSTYNYLYYSVVIFLILSLVFMFVFDYICNSTGLIINIYYNEGATDKFLYFMSNFYYYIKILFPILLVVITFIKRKNYRIQNKKKRR